MEIDSVLLRLPEDTLNAATVKNVILEQLKKDNILTDSEFEYYSVHYQIIVIKPNWFKKWATKFGIKNNEYQYKLVKFD